MRARRLKTMSPNIDGHGNTMKNLPGSHRMVGGTHLCMYHEIERSPLVLGNWRCGAVYMHIAYELARPYDGPDCQAVLNAVNIVNARNDVAADVLLMGAHAEGHPLPGVFTVVQPGYRIDFRVYPHNNARHLWAEVYRR